jgi:hypothetical protein
LGIARKANIAGVLKALAECTVTDAEVVANGELPSAPGLGRQPTAERMWASLAHEMRRAGAGTVGDLGDLAVGRWESALGLHYGGAEDVIRSLGRPK